MRKAFITLHIPGQKYPTLRIVEYPNVGERGFYTQTTSLSCFRRRELARAFPGKHRELDSKVNWVQYAQQQKYATVDWMFEGETTCAVNMECKMQGIALEDVPVSNGVWQLYEDIGYDRKTKKYVS